MASARGEAVVHRKVDYTLHIFVGHERVAELVQHPLDSSFSLQYEAAWVASEHGFALAPALPLRGTSTSAGIRRFLENLLPEGQALDDLARAQAISKSNVFGLIRHLGRETTGALTFLSPGLSPGEWLPVARELTFGELQERIAQRDSIPFTLWDGQVRMSVAGQQDKILVHKAGERLFLVDGSLASTHILKPEPLRTHLHHMVANEHYCMQLAGLLGQRAHGRSLCAEVELLRVPDSVLCIRRFDRVATADELKPQAVGASLSKVKRRHVIDACQAMDLPLSMKYERNVGSGKDVAHIRDGASLAGIHALRPLLENPAMGLRHITFWSILTLLLGNSDAHGKNLSFEVRPAGLTVAPLYDLVSVLAYDATMIDHEFAMAFGDAFRFEEVTPFALADHCERCGIDRRFFSRELRQLCKLAQELAVVPVQDPVYTPQERLLVQDVAQAVVQRARHLAPMADAIPRFSKDLF
jgi:serine/threonine-protein kinase HipA